MAKGNVKELLDKAKETVSNATHTVTDKAQEFFDNASRARETVAPPVSREEEVSIASEKLADSASERFLIELGDSPVPLTEEIIKKIKELFPVPREQCILWADAEFDRRPSGIVCTEKGVFIKSDVAVFPKKTVNGNGEKEREHSILLYYRWEDFEPEWFTAETVENNKALLTAPQCSERFVSVCRKLTARIATAENVHNGLSIEIDGTAENGIEAAAVNGVFFRSAQHSVFLEQNSALNDPNGGHGNLVEEYLTLLDQLEGKNATLIGNNGVKNGPDRIVNGSYIQTKYHKTATSTVNACFNGVEGTYQYTLNGIPMQLEVPKDQYEQVLTKFRNKIEAGKVPGITDPNDAEKIVRKGKLTYEQAVNLTKPGNVDSLKYDALNGIVTCSCVFGLTFVATAFLSWRQNGDIRQALKDGTCAGIQVFGISFLHHMLISQIARMSLADVIMLQPFWALGGSISHTYATLINAIRYLCGKNALSLTGATKIFNKILRSNAFSSTVSFVIFSIPDAYKLSMHKISKAQYAKNMTSLAGSIAMGAGTAKIAGSVGTMLLPGVGTAIGITVGGIVGGALGATAVGAVGNIIREDDGTVLLRLFNAVLSCMIGEYLFDSHEVDKLVKMLDEIPKKQFKKLFEEVQSSNQQEQTVRKFLSPHFDAVAKERTRFLLPPSEEIVEAIADSFEAEAE